MKNSRRMDVKLDIVKQENITLEDFPFICRICMKPGDLRPFEDEDYLLDLFTSITKINVRSEIDFPRNVCNECVKRLEDVSFFIDISKYNFTNPEKTSMPIRKNEKADTIGEADKCEVMTKENVEECGEGMSLLGSEICRLCKSPSAITSIDGKHPLIQLFSDVTKIDVEVEISSVFGNGLCEKCVGKLEDISSFISSALCNDRKLVYIIGRNGSVESESFSHESTACSDLEVKHVFNETDLTIRSIPDNMFIREIKEESGTIDIKENIFDRDLVVHIERMYRNDSKFKPQILVKEEPNPQLLSEPEKHLPCANNSNSKQHLGIHSEEKQFSSHDESKIHSQTCFGDEPLKSFSCGKKFGLKSSLENRKQSNTGEKPYNCYYCDRSFFQERHLKTHMHVHTRATKSFYCSLCDMAFLYSSSLQNHLRKHTGEKPYKCDHCGKGFSQSSGLTMHMFIHTGEKPFECNFCGKRFIRSTHMRRHLLIHTGEKPFECDFCDKSFNLSSGLQFHLRTHTGEKPFKCDRCDRCFSKKQTLRGHILVHTGEKPFKCDYCDHSFRMKQTLTNHIQTHTGEKPFKCDRCGRNFREKRNLKSHIQTHTGEKPFKCDHCDRRFGFRQSLKEHMETHTGKKSFKCDCCKKSFFLQKHLKSHMEIHTKKKPFKCDICDKCFGLKKYLRKHIHNHTR